MPTALAIASATAWAAAADVEQADWRTYINDKYGYQVQYPAGFDLWPTGLEHERDGARIRIAFKEHAAPAPVLDIQIEPRVSPEVFPTVRSPVKDMSVSLDDVRMNGVPARLAQYRWTASGELAMAEIYREGVLFRFQASPGLREFRKSEWWAIASTFRLLEE